MTEWPYVVPEPVEVPLADLIRQCYQEYREAHNTVVASQVLTAEACGVTLAEVRAALGFTESWETSTT